jgi:hypothetical protein
MGESRNALAVSQSPTETATVLSFEERWALWEAKGARHDARTARNMRVILALMVTSGVIWASILLSWGV